MLLEDLRNYVSEVHTTDDRKIELVAEVVYNHRKRFDFSFNSLMERGWSTDMGWVYFITINGEIFRVGQTDQSLCERLSSYSYGQSGQLVSQGLSEAICNGEEILVYAFPVPRVSRTENILGVEQTVMVGNSLIWESNFLEIIEAHDGFLPEGNVNQSLRIMAGSLTNSERGNVKYGFKRLSGDTVENMEEQRMLRKMLNKRSKNFSYAKIAEFMNNRGHKTRQGREWNRSSVRHVLYNSTCTLV